MESLYDRMVNIGFKVFTLLILFVPSFLLPVSSLCAEELSIGVFEFPENLSLVEPRSPVSELILTLVGEILVEPNGDDGRFRLRLASSLRSAASGAIWEVKLREGDLRFHNLQPIQYEDVAQSLLVCRALKSILSSVSPNDDGWIRLDLLRPVSHLESELSRCPIVPRQLLGSLPHFGTGTQYVSAGPYWIREVKPGRSYELENFRSYSRPGERPDSLEIRLIRDNVQALQGLRSGTLVAVLTDDEDLLTGVPASDPTLAASRCSFGGVLHRRQISWRCSPKLDVRELRYAS